MIIAEEQAINSFYQVINITETTGLTAIPKNRQVFATRARPPTLELVGREPLGDVRIGPQRVAERGFEAAVRELRAGQARQVWAGVAGASSARFQVR